jgi:3-hydroxyisobutyrate dehydrogenase-like beta-hydroxyacid dehydrogenase
MKEINSVAVIGIGEIGGPVAHHLRDGGYDVTVFDVNPTSVEPFEDTDIAVADGPSEAAAETDCSLLCVGTYDQVELVLFEDGILAGASEGHVVGIVSTISPGQAIDLAKVTETEGVDLVDVPVCRGKVAAEEGNLLVLGGGREAVFERVRPVFEEFAEPADVVYLGDTGSGQVGKAANNMLLWTTLVADYEVLSLAKAWNVDLDILRSALTRSSGDNWALRKWDWQYVGWAQKDMDIVLEMADQKDEPLPLAGLMSQLVRQIDDENLDEVR